MSLWHESFHSLRRRFEAASDQHGALYCVMVERLSASGHAEYADFPRRQPPDASTAGGGVHLYGEPKIVQNEVRPPRAREWRFYGKPAAREAFDRLAQDAGRLVGPSGPSIHDCIAAETLAADQSQRWLWVIFDLAWSPIEGSPLAARRMAWAGNVSIPLDQVDSQRRMQGGRLDNPFGQALASIPDPPDAFFSVIEDLLAASYFAIDRLLGCVSVGAQPDDDYDVDFRSGQWFTLNTRIRTGRLRQAANPKRKTKRVQTKTIDGVKCYSVSDARRWWPSDMHGR